MADSGGTLRSAPVRSGWARRRAAVVVLLLFAACAGDERAGVAPPAPPVPASGEEVAAHTDARPPAVHELLPDGGPLIAELAPGESHLFRLVLQRGDFLRLTVEPRGIDVAVELAGPGGEVPGEGVLVGADRRWLGRYGREPVLAVAERSGEHFVRVAGADGESAGRFAIRIESLRPSAAADRRLAEAFREWNGEPIPEQETALLVAARDRWRELGEPALEGDASLLLAVGAHGRGDLAEATERFAEASAAYRRGDDRGAAALAQRYLGDVLVAITRVEEAVVEYRAALELAHELDEPGLLARLHYGIGRGQKDQGELQDALDHYERALRLHPADDPLARASTLHDLGVLVARYLGDEPRGRRLLEAALESWPPDSARRRATLHQLGQLGLARGDLDQARRWLDEALTLDAQSPCHSAITLARLALVDQRSGTEDGADRRLAEATAAVAGGACPVQEATVHRLGAAVAEERGDGAAARDGYRRSLALYARWGDRVAQAEMLGGVARAERLLGRPLAALEASERALAIYETVRPTVLREDLRTAFFADAAQDLFDLHVALLVDQGRAAEAWVAAERARAQALRDLLAEAGAGLRARSDPELIGRERALQHRLNLLDGRLRSLAGRADRAAERRGLDRDLDATVAELERVRGEIRRGDPDAGDGAGAITLAGLRAALDPGALLLEYRLGVAESWLWAVTADRLEVFRLPPRSEIEAAAGTAIERLRSLRFRPGRNPRPVCTLASMLLPPEVARQRGAPLLVVADGALERVPFAALPDPAAGGCESAPLLVAEHHGIVHLPSLATLSSQRRLRSGDGTAPGWLAVVADPVYEPDDERLGGAAGLAGAARARTGGPAGGAAALRRLPHTGAEAAAIAGGLPADRVFAAAGPDATREAVTDGAAEGFRILHVAAHGVLDPDRPLLSFLALSRFDRRGRPIEGDLYAHEIYGLDLPAELVVLSACETAVGSEVRGEALSAGLPRAFLYAGAERVLVSLWRVPDDGTRELMTLFYRGLIDHGLPPAGALREAQLELVAAGRRPHQWAGFVLQGDPRPLPPFIR